MLQNVKNAANRTKKFVDDHKVAIAVVATSIVWIGINRMALSDHDNFLKAHGLHDEYYALTDEE